MYTIGQDGWGWGRAGMGKGRDGDGPGWGWVRLDRIAGIRICSDRLGWRWAGVGLDGDGRAYVGMGMDRIAGMEMGWEGQDCYYDNWRG